MGLLLISQENLMVEVMCLGSFTIDYFIIEFFTKALKLLVRTMTSILLFILQNSHYFHLWLWLQISFGTLLDKFFLL